MRRGFAKRLISSLLAACVLFMCALPLVSSADNIEDLEFEHHLDEQGFPESYRASLRTLHSVYPEWEFIAAHTGVEWSVVVAKESVIGKNLVPSYSNRLYINTADVDSSGRQIGRDGSSWVAASTGITQYYLDPRNFLNLNYIFQFESLSYSPSGHSLAGIEQVLAGTFMSSSNTFSANGTTYTYAQTFMAAAQATGVSPYHLASRVKQEQGSGGTQLSFGTVPGYNGCYNFFNIGAYPAYGRSSVVNGAITARNNGWTNQYVSIVQGSSFIGNSYIKQNQDTIYFQKFNTNNGVNAVATHQYMTNVMAAASEATIMRNAYPDKNVSISFKIPVYNNMPDIPAPRPTAQNTPSYSISSYSLNSGYLTKVAPKTNAASILSRLTVSGGSVKIINSSGAAKYGATPIATGDMLLIYNSLGNIYRSFPIIIYGDIDGDGEITLLDLLALQKHLREQESLSGYSLVAADTSRGGGVSVVDLLLLKRTLMNLSKIKQ